SRKFSIFGSKLNLPSYLSPMKKLKFPTAHTILILIALVVTILTWIIPAGKYDSLAYNASNNIFTKVSIEQSEELPATQETLDGLGIKIPVEKFMNGDIYKPIGIPNTYKSLDSKPQGAAAFALAP